MNGAAIMDPADAAEAVYLRLIGLIVCNQLQFPPLETQEDYRLNLDSSNRTLKSVPVNLVDQVWKQRPPVLLYNLTRLPDRVIRGFCSVHTRAVCPSAFYLRADKYL